MEQSHAATLSLRDERNREVVVTILERSHPSSDDYWDGNWLEGEVVVNGGCFRGACSLTVLAQELAALRLLIDEVILGSRESFDFKTMESGLAIHLGEEERGSYPLRLRVCADEECEESIVISSSISGEALRALTERIAVILERYPVRGKPDVSASK